MTSYIIKGDSMEAYEFCRNGCAYWKGGEGDWCDIPDKSIGQIARDKCPEYLKYIKGSKMIQLKVEHLEITRDEAFARYKQLQELATKTQEKANQQLEAMVILSEMVMERKGEIK